MNVGVIVLSWLVLLPGVTAAKVARGHALGSQKTDTVETSTPTPDAAGVYRPGGAVKAPVLTYSVEPQFSEKARKRKVGGTSVVSLVVDTEGRPQDVQIFRSATLGASGKDIAALLTLDDKALEAVRQYHFTAGTLEGKAVPVRLKVEVNFQTF